jgi:hypothetical protein
MWGGTAVYVVEPGTVIRDEATGAEIEVSDIQAAHDLRGIHVTQAVYNALRAALQQEGGE